MVTAAKRYTGINIPDPPKPQRKSTGDSGRSGGIGFMSALALLFIALKLTGYIDWPWYLVLGPLWMPIAAALGVLLVLWAACGVIVGFMWLVEKLTK